MFDAAVCVVGCDKTIPAAAMALAHGPGLFLRGTIAQVITEQGVTIRTLKPWVRTRPARYDAGYELEGRLSRAGACGGQ
jgi:dihydroxyacid dehydratase/phosphogluconate dehydratase